MGKTCRPKKVAPLTVSDLLRKVQKGHDGLQRRERRKERIENEARSELSALIQGEKFLSDGEVPFLPICFTHSVSFPPYVIGL